MGGYDKAKQTAEKLRSEVQEQQEKAVATTEEVKNQLAVLSQNSELAQMYADNAKVGADNLGADLPLLKVHAVGKSTKNELADGSEPKDGFFFYKPNQEEFNEVVCHILTISKGFRSPGMDEGKTEKFNQIVGGVIVDNGEYKPFIMYFTGTKLAKLWEFGKEASQYTRKKPISIPMFVLTVKLTTEKITTDFGKNWVVNFQIVKTADGTPQLVLDPGEFQFLKDNVATVEDTITALIEAKTSRQTIEGAALQGDTPEGVPFS